MSGSRAAWYSASKSFATSGRSSIRSPVSVGWRSKATATGLLRLVVRLLQRRNVELDHLQQRLHDAFGPLGVLVGHQLAEHRRDDLPREPEPVLEPTAS